MIHLLGIEVRADVLAELAVQVAPILRMPCQVRPERLDVAFAYDRNRNQYHSTAILQAMQPLVEAGARLLGNARAHGRLPFARGRRPRGRVEFVVCFFVSFSEKSGVFAFEDLAKPLGMLFAV